MKLKPSIPYIIPVITFFIGFAIPSIYLNYHSDQNNKFIETRQQGNYQLINPLLECDSANFAQDPNLYSLRDQITDYLNHAKSNSQIAFASIYYRDLNNGPWIGINEKELFSPASLVKVPIMITYFKQAEKDPEILNQILILTSSVTSSKQNILPQATLEIGKSYTVQDLINRMIIYSDNKAYELLSYHIDSKLVIKTYNDLGIDVSKGLTDPFGNILSVRDYASFFRVLYNSSYLSKGLSEKALQILSQVNYQDGLVAGIDSKITIAHKFGERVYENTGEKQLHDCGIVYLPGKPYLICVMTRGLDFKNLSTFIQQVSRIIFNRVNS